MKRYFFIIFTIAYSLNIVFGINYSSCNSTVPSGVHYLTNDVYSNNGLCFTIVQDNVTLDCNGYRIIDNGSSMKGVTQAALVNNITIQNCVIEGFNYGIYLINTNKNTVKDSTLTNNIYSVYLSYANNNLVDNITVLGSFGNMELEWTSSNNIFSDIKSPNGSLIFFDEPSNNTFQNSTFETISFSTPFSNIMSDNNFFNNYLGNFSSIAPDWSNVLNSNFTGNHFLEGTVPNPPCFPPENTTCDYSYQNYSVISQQVNSQSSSSNAFPFGNLLITIITFSLFMVIS